MGKSVFHGPVCLSDVSASERAERRFADNDAVIQTVREWIRRQPQAFLESASGCFQNVGKNVLTPEGITLNTDMYK
jgi:hypothetical protein